MKRSKTLTILLVLVMLVSIVAIPAMAQPNKASLQEYLTDLYMGGSHLYTIKDTNGNVSTEKFLQDTLEFFKAGDWTKIEQYIDRNTSELCKILAHVTLPGTQKGTEVGAREYRSYIVLKDVVSYESVIFKGTRAKIWYDTMGEFYYDNATFLVTRALTPTITVTEIELKTAAGGTMHQDGITWYINGVNPSVSVSANRGTASYTTNFYMECSLDGFNMKYDVISNTYTASPRP